MTQRQDFGPQQQFYTIEYIRVDELTTPVNIGQVPYQRDQGSNGNPPTERLAARAEKYGDYDPRLLRFREVNRRTNGVLATMDGNGSNHWLLMMFGPDYLVPCKVYSDLTVEIEAKMFEGFQHIKQVGLTDRYNADVIAKETTALTIQKVFAEKGFTIGSRSPGRISYSAAQYAMKVGENHLRKLLDLVSLFPETDYNRTNSELVKAISDALTREGMDEDALKRTLKSASPKALREGKNGYAAHNIAFKNILAIYGSQNP